MTIFHARPFDLLGTRCCCWFPPRRRRRWRHRPQTKDPDTLFTIRKSSRKGKMRAVVRRKQCWKNECSLVEGGNLTMVTTIEQSLVDGVCARCVFIQSVMQLGKSASTAEKNAKRVFTSKTTFSFCSSATRGTWCGREGGGGRQSSFIFAPTLPVLCSVHITASFSF